ncbi:MAG: response regulator [Deltaproteobacteria bacterium]|nr:response regulator [Kofleriaceae bacterium]
MLVPILVGGRTVALFELFRTACSAEARFVKVASTVAAQLGSLIERRRAEDALRASEARFARLAESGIVGIAVADLDGKIHEANDAYLAMFGYTRHDLDQGVVCWREQASNVPTRLLAHALSGLTSRGSVGPLERVLVRKDGAQVPVLVGAAMLDDTRCIAVVSDLTERKRSEQVLRATEEQLRHAQKMEAVGKLAGGVAHDFNNILSVIISYSDLVRADLSPGDPMRADLDEIHQAGERAAQLTRQLLAFSRQQVVEPRVLDLDEVIRGMEKMTRRLVGEDVEVLSMLHAGVGRVLADPGNLEQILMNLVVNARDAMPEGGKLTIETTEVVLDDDFVRAHVGASAGRHVMLAVSDTGVGMDRATQARIFEPFFTTKPKDRGTGLGLSTVFGIVSQCGGTIWVYSEPGIGTTFKVFLPCVDAELEGRPATRAPQPARGTECVLLVEDDDQVRVVMRDILERAGYRVLEARNAGEALLIAEQPHAIDLVLSDVVMPHMSGPEVLRRIAALRPGIRALCMSGYTDNAVLHHQVLERQIAFLQKPVTPGTLTRKVREVLDEPPTASAA